MTFEQRLDLLVARAKRAVNSAIEESYEAAILEQDHLYLDAMYRLFDGYTPAYHSHIFGDWNS